MNPALDQLDTIIQNVEQALDITSKQDKSGITANESSTQTGKDEKLKTEEAVDSIVSDEKREQQQKKKKYIKKNKGPKPEASPPLPPEKSQFLQCDLRIGLIKSITSHPEASGLYVLSVSYGDNEDERTVCAGLRDFLTEEELLKKKVVTICNLKPRNLRGVDSQAMILAGSIVSGESKEKVVPLSPKIDVDVGSIVMAKVVLGEAIKRTVENGKFVSAKNWDRVVGRLSVKDGLACYDGQPLVVGDTPVVCELPDGSEIH